MRRRRRSRNRNGTEWNLIHIEEDGSHVLIPSNIIMDKGEVCHMDDEDCRDNSFLYSIIAAYLCNIVS